MSTNFKNAVLKLLVLTMLKVLSSNAELMAQGFIIYGDKTFGTSGTEGANCHFILNNDTLYILGAAGLPVGGDKTDSICDVTIIGNDYWLVKTDLHLNKILDRSIGGNLHDYPFRIFINNKNQLILSGYSYSDSSCEKSENARFTNQLPDYWIVAYNADGSKVWDKTYGGSMLDEGTITVQLTSGNYVTCGGSNSPVSYDKSAANWGGVDYWCVKYDSAGNKIWDQVYGGIWGELALTASNVNKSFDIMPDEGDSFLIAGSTSSPVSGNISQPKFDVLSNLYDIWIIKIDSLGNKIWDRRYGGDNMDVVSGGIRKLSDGYLIVGRTNSQQGGNISPPSIGTGINADVLVLRLDTLGNKIWDRRYGGINTEFGAWVEPAIDGGYIICASTNSPAGYDISEPPYGNQNGDYWIFKIDTAGNKLWDKRFGGPGTNVPSSFIQLPDSSIYLFGVADSGTTAVKTDPGKGSLDYWIIHFKYTNGPTGIDETVYGNGQFSLSPNPASTQLTLQYSPPKTTGRATVFNSTGSKVSEINLPKNSHSQQLDISPYSSGLYLLKIETESYTGAKKFFKL